LPKPTTLKHPRATTAGLAIALLATPIYLRAFQLFAGESRSNWQTLGRELGIWLCVAVLLWVVRHREGLPLTSLGLRADRPTRSLLRGVLLALLVLAVTVALGRRVSPKAPFKLKEIRIGRRRGDFNRSKMKQCARRRRDSQVRR